MSDATDNRFYREKQETPDDGGPASRVEEVYKLLKPGNVLKDMDDRQQGRTVRVIEVLPNGIVGQASPSGKVVRIMLKFIHADDKPRKSGFNLVREAQS